MTKYREILLLMLTSDGNVKTLLPVSDLPCILSKERDPRASFLTCKFCSNGTPILKSAVHSF